MFKQVTNVVLRLKKSDQTNSSWEKISDKGIRLAKNNSTHFFDNILDQKQSNYDLFEKLIPFIDQQVSYGENGLFILYGNKDSGKELTFDGDDGYDGEDGFLQLLIGYLFYKITNSQGIKKVKMACFEIQDQYTIDLIKEESQLQKQQYLYKQAWLKGSNSNELLDKFNQCLKKRQKLDKTQSFIKVRYQNADYIKKDFVLIDLASYTTTEEQLQNDQNLILLKFLRTNSRFLNIRQLPHSKEDNYQISESLLYYYLVQLAGICEITVIIHIDTDEQKISDGLKAIHFAQDIISLTQSINNGFIDYQNTLEEKFNSLIQQQNDKYAELSNKYDTLSQRVTTLEKGKRNLKREKFHQNIQDNNRKEKLTSNRKKSEVKPQEQQIEQKEQLGVIEQDSDENERDKQVFKFNFECFEQLLNNQYNQLFQVYKKKNYKRTSLVLLTKCQDVQNIKNQVIQLFNFNLSSYTLLNYKQQYTYVIVELQQSQQFRLSYFENSDFDLIDSQPNEHEKEYMSKNLTLLVNADDNANLQVVEQQHYGVEIRYQQVDELDHPLILQSLKDLKLKSLKHLIFITELEIKFAVIFKKEQPITILQYFHQYQEPSVKYINNPEDYIQEVNKLKDMKGKVFVIKNGRFEKYIF